MRAAPLCTRSRTGFPPRTRFLGSVALLLGLLLPVGLRARPPVLTSAPPGVIETGVPTFIVLGPAALGLSSPPTDIHVLPDGRTLVVAPAELAIGDGVRWETFHRRADTDPVPLHQIVVADDGALYASVANQFARIEFGPDAQWGFVPVAAFPPELAQSGRVLSRVSAAGGEWYWTAGNGALVAWHPGRTAKLIGRLNDLERVLSAGGETFVSDPSRGALYRIVDEALTPFGNPTERNVGGAVVSSLSLPDGRTLLGTYALGAQLFDGTTLRPLTDRGLLAGHSRIADLCAAGAGYICAALDNVGLVFFNAQGQVVQVLDRTVDHRLSRVRRLLQAPGGGVWALLNDGIAQVEFPARLSHFEPRVTSGLTFAQLCRHEGRLWLLADGQAQRGVYDDDGRLLRFDTDTPPPFVNTAASAGGRLLIATARGLFQRVAESWEQVTPDLPDALAVPDAADPDRWLYVAQGEVGWLRFTAAGPVTERVPVPGLGNAFSALLQTGNVFWAELGSGHIARIQAGPDGRLAVRVLGPSDGLPDNWAQAFLVDGVVRFNFAGQVLRYDEASDRMLPDLEFLKTTPGLLGEEGRPARDTNGRLWITTNQAVRVLDDRRDPTATTSLERMPRDFRPSLFLMEEHGVVWLHRRNRLLRFDPAIPELPVPPLRAVISHVQLVSSNRHWVFPGASLPSLDYQDNSLTAQFLAPNAVFGQPVAFEVQLEGAGGTWTPTGPAGSASFSRLKEGRYVLRVRPRSGEVTGLEARLTFTLRPPWFRTPLAYGLYLLATAGLLLAVAAGWTHLARLEKARLEHLIAQRTGELQRSEERYRRLNEELEERVRSRTAELESFSYSISHDLRAPLRNISGFADLLHKRLAGQLVPETRHFLEVVSTEALRLGQLIDSLLGFSRLGRTELKRQRCDLGELVEAVRRELQPSLSERQIEWRIAPLATVDGDPTLLRQVFANLIGNALKFSRQRQPAVIEIGEAPAEPAGTGPAPAELILFVRDNGAGFDPRYGDKLFGVFQRLHRPNEFEGTGIGLANVRQIVTRHGGRVWAIGEPNNGATFFIALPRPVATPGD